MMKPDFYSDFPEAETMETRRAMKKRSWGIGFFWGVLITVVILMFAGDWIISLLQ